MANRGEAYDFDLFEDFYSSSAPQRQPQIEDLPRVVELPRQEPEQRPRRQARPKRNPLKRMAAFLSFLIIFGLGIALVYSEVQLTELGNEINKTRTALEEAESLEVQLTMQAASRMTDAQVEAYAIQQLGMGKLTGSQVVYLHVAQQDRGTVVQDIEGGSWLDQLMAKLRAWTS